MRTPHDKTPPAFPAISHNKDSALDDADFKGVDLDTGMTLRQWYIGQVLSGILSNSAMIDGLCSVAVKNGQGNQWINECIAKKASEIVDAVLAYEVTLREENKA